jgi:hypothetical protein
MAPSPCKFLLYSSCPCLAALYTTHGYGCMYVLAVKWCQMSFVAKLGFLHRIECETAIRFRKSALNIKRVHRVYGLTLDQVT